MVLAAAYVIMALGLNVVAGAIVLSVVNSHLLPNVLYGVPPDLGLDFDLSQIASGIYGLLLVIVMLLRPVGLLPERRQDV